jgi:hypothetical protein
MLGIQSSIVKSISTIEVLAQDTRSLRSISGMDCNSLRGLFINHSNPLNDSESGPISMLLGKFCMLAAFHLSQHLHHKITSSERSGTIKWPSTLYQRKSEYSAEICISMNASIRALS